MSGTNSDVAGMFSAIISMKTENASRTVIPSVIFSRGGHVLGNHQHEDGERQQNGDSERNLFAGVGRQPEPDQTEHGQPQTRKYDVEEHLEPLSQPSLRHQPACRSASTIAVYYFYLLCMTLKR